MREQFNELLELMKDPKFDSNSLEERTLLLAGLTKTTEMLLEYQKQPERVWMDGLELAIITLDDLLSRSFVRLEKERAANKRANHERES